MDVEESGHHSIKQFFSLLILLIFYIHNQKTATSYHVYAAESILFGSPASRSLVIWGMWLTHDCINPFSALLIRSKGMTYVCVRKSSKTAQDGRRWVEVNSFVVSPPPPTTPRLFLNCILVYCHSLWVFQATHVAVALTAAHIYTHIFFSSFIVGKTIFKNNVDNVYLVLPGHVWAGWCCAIKNINEVMFIITSSKWLPIKVYVCKPERNFATLWCLMI